jgi:hypothetical protein
VIGFAALARMGVNMGPTGPDEPGLFRQPIPRLLKSRPSRGLLKKVQLQGGARGAE